jgi:hypothetical protein
VICEIRKEEKNGITTYLFSLDKTQPLVKSLNYFELENEEFHEFLIASELTGCNIE